MDQFGYPVSSLAAARHDAAFLGLMNFQADRAIGLYQSAQKALPAIDRRNMVAAEIMRTVYRRLLTDMQRSQFRVFQKRYRLNTLEKALCIGRVLVSTALS
jgi:phytoene/squalene synthetase